MPFKTPDPQGPMGRMRVYRLNEVPWLVQLHTYNSGNCFIHIGDACIVLTREQTRDLLVEARGQWSKKY